ncbi:MAG: hypothetical protein ACREWG_14845 [Gammaproteobacteria bacterium]
MIEIAFLFGFFVVSFGVFTLVMLVDARTVVVRPGKLTVAEGSSEVSSPAATASHDEGKDSGQVQLHVNVSGAGRGQAVSMLGCDLEVRGKKPGKYFVVVDLEHRAHLRVAEGAGRAKYSLALQVNAKSVPILAAEQGVAGEKRLPANGEMVATKKKFFVALTPGQPCKAMLVVTAVAEPQAADDKINCTAEVVAKVKEFQLRPFVGNFFTTG